MDGPVDKGSFKEVIDNHKGNTCPVILKVQWEEVETIRNQYEEEHLSVTIKFCSLIKR